ncbi:MAG: FG-GAP repeat protein [Gemmatimonadaceae bacterium]|nr:FG-GAP repeat protein [Gloeobacterales cyanobacterium ES-bin-141]
MSLSTLLPMGSAAPVLAQVSAPGCLGPEPAGLGFVLDGAVAFEGAGRSVSSAGDVNGDGIPDLIVGVYRANAQGRSNAGRAYVVFGKANTALIDLANLGNGGFAIEGAAVEDSTGNSVASAGDVNGDGIPDLIVGASRADPQGRSDAGRAYVVFGKADTATVDLANLGNSGFAINGATARDYAGGSVSSAGDINGDGLADLIIGASRADPQGRAGAGQAYVVFGKANTATVDLVNLGNSGFAINGTASHDYAGNSVSSAGDINGDRIPDLVVGARGADPQGRLEAGQVYVVFGKADTATVDLANLGSGGFAIEGEASLVAIGLSVSSAGDVSGDGIPDLLIGAGAADIQNRVDAGRVYVVFGKANTALIDLANLGSGGFVLDGATAYDYAGISVSSAGDVNGDGIPDLIIGASRADPQGRIFAGRAYVVFGKRTDTNPIDLRNVQLSATPDVTAALLGAAVTFTGNNLSSVSAITLGTVAVPFALNSSTRLTAVLPANALNGVSTLTLSTPLDGTLSFGFEVLPRPSRSPSILSVTPTTGSPGTRVIASGADLLGATVRFCNGVPAFSRSIRTRVLFEVPSGATSGPVTVTTAGGSYNFLFTVPLP